MPTIHALLVAINDYPSAPLKGCINDLEAMQIYLEDHCKKNNLKLNQKTLLNNQATRAEIIEGFSHFRNANPNDTCLFFFAGHGSHYKTPDVFKHLEPDGELETLVCYDSRSSDRDLIDKELSFLIWEVSNSTKNPFITIIDCCHSGTFRIDKNSLQDEAIREIKPSKHHVSPEEFYGYQRYIKEPGGKLSPPMARRIHLGAARDIETAKEVRINGKRRGVFTDSLLDVLNQTSSIISYRELIKRVNHIIQKAVRDQLSQLWATQVNDKKLLFLSDQSAPDKQHFLVSHHKQLGWTIDVGSIYGISVGNQKHKTTFSLIKDHHQIEVNKVLPHLSLVQPMDGYNKNITYPAILKELAQYPFQLAYSKDIDLNGLQFLREAITENESELFKIVPAPKEAEFLIQAKDNSYYLTRKEQKKKIGWNIKGFTKSAASSFLKEMETMLKWFQVLLMDNPNTSIKDNEFSISFKKVIEPGNYENDTKVEELDWQSPCFLEYTNFNNNWHKPAFQLNISNTGYRPLSVSVLYLSSNFGITNQLIPCQILEPNHKVWALDHAEGKSFTTIRIQVDDYYLRQGIDIIEDHLKIIICTDPFDTDTFNQKGIILQDDERTRSMAPRAQGSLRTSDWRCQNISLVIQGPKNI